MSSACRFINPRARGRGLLLFVWAVALISASAQPPRNQSGVIRSVSGQFVIRSHSSRDAFHPPPAHLVSNPNLVELEPTLVAVSCERIKQFLVREFASPLEWHDKIYVSLYPATDPGEPLGLTSDLFKNGWSYGLELPDFIERERYTTAIVQVLLQEAANSGSLERSAELPLWLVEGLAQELRSSGEMAIILSPPRGTSPSLKLNMTSFNATRENPLEQAHKTLLQHAPLSFDQLSWPNGSSLESEQGDAYRASAQLFVNELQALKGGRACLAAMLQELPRHLNWQIAFLKAFQNHFQRPLDVEKWWALRAAEFTGRDLEHTWPPEESLGKLAQALKVSIRTQAGTNELPADAFVNLQTVMREWDRVREGQALKRKLNQLDMVRLRASPQVVGLVDSYRQVIAHYVANENKPGLLLTVLKNAARNRAVEDAVKQLNSLDARRLAFGSELLPITEAGVKPTPAVGRGN